MFKAVLLEVEPHHGDLRGVVAGDFFEPLDVVRRGTGGNRQEGRK